MFDILAAVNWEDLVLMGTAVGVFGGGKVAYNAIKGKPPHASREVCPLHESTMQLMSERKEMADQDRAEIKASIKEVKDNMRADFDIIFRKLDILHASVKNGQKP